MPKSFHLTKKQIVLWFSVGFFGALASAFLTGCTDSAHETMKHPPQEVIEITEVDIITPHHTDADKMAMKEILEKAYATEYGARVRYENWALKADSFGAKRIADFLRALASSEAVHANEYAAMLKKMGENPVANTEIPEVASIENLLDEALNFEKKAVSEFYPAQLELLKKLTSSSALDKTLEAAMANDEAHVKVMEEIQKDWKTWNAKTEPFSVCQVCGHLEQNTPPQSCPKCGAAKERFLTFGNKETTEQSPAPPTEKNETVAETK